MSDLTQQPRKPSGPGEATMPVDATGRMMDAGVAAMNREELDIDGNPGHVMLRAAYDAMLASRPAGLASPEEAAYGALWRIVTDDPAHHELRALLRIRLDRQAQGRGVQWAVANLPEVTLEEVSPVIEATEFTSSSAPEAGGVEPITSAQLIANTDYARGAVRVPGETADKRVYGQPEPEPVSKSPENEQGDGLIHKLYGPHEWGYRCPVEGGFIEDRTPFDAATALEAANRRIAELEEALEPFASAAGKLDGLWAEDDWRWNDSVRSNVTVRDLRRAARAFLQQGVKP